MSNKKQPVGQLAPHTGNLLKSHFQKKRIRKNALARALGRNTSTLFGYLENGSMQTSVLWEICIVLKHNFLLDIANELPKEFSNNVETDHRDQEKIAELARENEILKQQLELLQEILKR